MEASEIIHFALVFLLIIPIWFLMEKAARKKVDWWAEENGFIDIEEIKSVGCWYCVKKWCPWCACVVGIQERDGNKYRVCLNLGMGLMSTVTQVSKEPLA